MPSNTPITVAYGDGIGPEIVDATLFVLREAGALIEPETIEIGKKVYERGITTGIPDDAWESLRRTRVFLKGPITTPQGGGYKSLNVTIRKSMSLFANVRPCRSYYPFVQTFHPDVDLVIIRENEEDLYAGIEHQQTNEVTQCLKLISRPGSERIVRYAFEYARRRQRKELVCLSKDNIMKLTDGLFHKVFDEVATEYPDVEARHLIVDIGMARVADTPAAFDVVVVPNLYGDILSDITAQISGSVGLGGSANIGLHGAMFEAIHGTAPDIAGRGIANPSGVIHGACKMLAHIGQGDTATLIHNAWLKTLEDGIHTGDIYRNGVSKQQVGTKDFAQAIAQRLGHGPKRLKPAQYAKDASPMHRVERRPRAKKELVGIDVFLDWWEGSPDELGAALKEASTAALQLNAITNRGLKVWPDGPPEAFCTDHWRCRFVPPGDGGAVGSQDILDLLASIDGKGFEFIKTEHLYTFDGKPGFSLPQGQ